METPNSAILRSLAINCDRDRYLAGNRICSIPHDRPQLSLIFLVAWCNTVCSVLKSKNTRKESDNDALILLFQARPYYTFYFIWSRLGLFGTTAKEFIKGALTRGFCRFLDQTILKLVVANVTHSEHYRWSLKEDITLIRKEKTNHRH